MKYQQRMAIRTLKLTPNQTKMVYDMVVDKKHEIEDLRIELEKTEQTKPSDVELVKNYEISLKQIISQIEKKL
jgi:hypothetical protein